MNRDKTPQKTESMPDYPALASPGIDRRKFFALASGAAAVVLAACGDKDCDRSASDRPAQERSDSLPGSVLAMDVSQSKPVVETSPALDAGTSLKKTEISFPVHKLNLYDSTSVSFHLHFTCENQSQRQLLEQKKEKLLSIAKQYILANVDKDMASAKWGCKQIDRGLTRQFAKVLGDEPPKYTGIKFDRIHQRYRKKGKMASPRYNSSDDLVGLEGL